MTQDITQRQHDPTGGANHPFSHGVIDLRLYWLGSVAITLSKDGQTVAHHLMMRELAQISQLTDRICLIVYRAQYRAAQSEQTS